MSKMTPQEMAQKIGSGLLSFPVTPFKADYSFDEATYRANMAKAQTLARTMLMEHGIKFVDPTPEQIAAIRAKMMPTQDALAVELKVSPALVKQAMAALNAKTN